MTGCEVTIFLRGEYTQDVIVLVHGFTPVAAILLVPPVSIRITERALDGNRIDIATILSSWSVFNSGAQDIG